MKKSFFCILIVLLLSSFVFADTTITTGDKQNELTGDDAVYNFTIEVRNDVTNKLEEYHDINVSVNMLNVDNADMTADIAVNNQIIAIIQDLENPE